MATRTWKCQRVAGGVKCGQQNPKRKLICDACGKKRPPTKKPDHMKALDLSYEEYVELNGGDFCWVCLCPPSPVRRLDRDHDHLTGAPRGLLCHTHNRMLRHGMTPTILRRLADYLERFQ